jgi:hypothetical protein
MDDGGQAFGCILQLFRRYLSEDNGFLAQSLGDGTRHRSIVITCLVFITA